MRTSEAMREIERLYKGYAGEYIASVKKIHAAELKIRQARSDAHLTEAGKQAQIDKLREGISAERANMAALAKTADEKAAQIRRTVQERFFARPDDVDLKAMQLLSSGILTDDEIISMAHSQYKNNSTMQRILAKRLSQSEKQEARAAGLALEKGSSAAALACVDAIINAGKYCLGAAPLSGADGSETMRDRWNELTAAAWQTVRNFEG